MSNLLLIVSVILLSLSSVGIGSLFLKKISVEDQKLNLYLSFFSGQIFISFVWMVITTLVAKPINTLIMVPILLFFSYHGLKKISYINLNLSIKNLVDKYLIVILLILVFIYLFNSLTPAFEWDVISYRLPVVEELSLGKVKFPLLQSSPYTNYFTSFIVLFGNFPYSSESYFSILYSVFNNGSLAHLLNLTNFIFLILVIIDFSAKIYNTNLTSNLCIAILVFLNHGISIILPTGLIDLNLAIYQFLALLSVYLIRKDYGYIYLFILFASYSLAQKYISFFVIAPIFIYLVIVLCRDKYFSKLKFKGTLKLMVATIMLFIIGGGYWYLKNIIMYVNPVYPLYFGHLGIDAETYAHIMDTLVYGLRKGNGFVDLLESIKNNYINETGMTISLGIIIIGFIFNIIKRTSENIALLLLITIIYLSNFFIGSQLTRFILILPIIIYFIVGQAFTPFKWLGISTVIVSIMAIRLNPLQWSVWNSRFENITLFIEGKTDELYEKNIGCSYGVYKYLNNLDSNALNIWDPYASSFYKNKQIFSDVPNVKDLSTFKYNEKYLYINEQHKLGFLNDKYIHRDLFIDEKIRFEELLISEKRLVYSKHNCFLYKIK